MAETENKGSSQLQSDDQEQTVLDELTVLQNDLEPGKIDSDGPIENSPDTGGAIEGDPTVLSSIQMGTRDSETGAATNLANARVAEAINNDGFAARQENQDGDKNIDSVDHQSAAGGDLGERLPGDVGGDFGEIKTSGRGDTQQQEKNKEAKAEEELQQSQDAAAQTTPSQNHEAQSGSTAGDEIQGGASGDTFEEEVLAQKIEEEANRAANDEEAEESDQAENEDSVKADDDYEEVIAEETSEVEAANTAPTAADSSAMATEDTVFSGSVSGTDVDGDSLTYSLDSGPDNGTLTFNADGSYSYTPDANYNGTDSFSYQVSDGQGGTTTATVNLTVDPANDNPVSVDSAVTATEDTVFSGSVSGTDVDGDSLTYSLDSGPDNGTLTFNADGSYSYTPDANYNGTDSFSYQVSDGQGGTTTATVNLTVDPANDNPVSADSAITMDEDTTYSGTLIAGDVDGDILSFSLDNGPSHGTLVLNADGTYSYEPNADYYGADSFTYQVSDGQGGTASSTVSIDVDDVSEAIQGQLDDGEGLTYEVDDGPDHGTLNLEEDGSFTYTQDEGYGGDDSFSYRATDEDGDSAVNTVELSASTNEDEGQNLSGGRGIDKLVGGDGDDVIDGGSANDVLTGGSGDDVITGGDADGSGKNRQVGGDDKLYGGIGDDMLDGESGNDKLYGEVGDDHLIGGAGNDLIDGGLGNDTAEFSGDRDDYEITLNDDGSMTVKDLGDNDDGTDTVTDVESLKFADETLASEDISSGAAGSGRELSGQGNSDDLLEGDSGGDVINGGAGDDTLSGNAGDDVLDGGSGDDTLDGGSGDDTLEGGSGDDVLSGGSGADYLTGGSGEDVLTGGDGDDEIHAGSQDDQITGGSGDDYLYGDAGDDLFIWDIRDGNDHISGGSGWDSIALGDKNNQGSQDTGWTVTLEDGTQFVIDPSTNGDAYLDIASDTSGTIVDMEFGETITFDGLERIEF